MTTTTAVASTSASASANGSGHGEHITEDEASLYDRQIRLWGLEAQNRMRSSTVLIVSLRGVSHEIIKNLVLAGIGKLIVMDDGLVTEEDLGSGFLFREEDGAVGKERTEAASAQISSLNPLVSLQMMSTVSPLIGNDNGDSTSTDKSASEWLKQEGVDVVVACDLNQIQVDSLDTSTREAGVMFYATGSYGFYGYAFADLGDDFDFVYTPASAPEGSLVKSRLSYPSRTRALDSTNWSMAHPQIAQGGSPFRGLSRHVTKQTIPQTSIGVLALWEYERRHDSTPAASGQKEAEAVGEMMDIAEDLRTRLGINEKAITSVDRGMIEHLARHSAHHFPPTLAVLGGLVAQDVLRALSKRGIPFVNLLTVDSMGGTGAVVRWGMADVQAA